ncbi:MAG: hypothetical protein R3F42_00040 [Pseudomonadota bacterium]
MAPLFYLFGLLFLLASYYTILALIPAGMSLLVAVMSHLDFSRQTQSGQRRYPGYRKDTIRH